MAAKKIFNKYAVPKTQMDYSRSIFNYERTHSTNMLTGYIYPVAYLNCMPGDTIPNKFGFVLQSAPLLGPSLDNVYIDIISVWTPHRLVLGNFNEWLGDNDTYAYTLGNNIAYPKITKLYTGTADFARSGGPTYPRISKAYYAEHFLAPHIGCRYFKPSNGGQSDFIDFASSYYTGNRIHDGINVMPSRIYDLNWNRLFRNENIQAPILFSKQSGTDLALDMTNYHWGLGKLHKANRLKNFLTTAWPSPAIQTVDIGLGNDLPVLVGSDKFPINTGNPVHFADAASGVGISSSMPLGLSQAGNLGANSGTTFNATTNPVPDNLYADLSQLTVNSVYYAIMLQKYMNKATLGRRPVEFYQLFFGLSSSNAAFDDPQLLSQKRFKVNISRVVSTATATANDGDQQPLGTQGAFSVTSVGGTLFPEFTATEYGMVQIYAVIRTQESFSSGIDRYLTDGELLSTYLPTFDHIGPDYIEMTEFADYIPISSGAANVFGYQNAWYNYRMTINDVVGIMSPGEPLDYFTLSRNYAYGNTPIAINSAFIEQSPFEVDRMLQFPVFTGTPYGPGEGTGEWYDEDGELYTSNVYQWLIQFALAGDFARTMSKDSEPLTLGRL